ncbi:MAG: hypothetical protein KGI41_00965 [Patescibacteria group bacterium]|nr:hypothetical protein [Patescibacteria group bacterium]MDE1965800.1 hypothetical protein [Patescibacteria group bacterium]
MNHRTLREIAKFASGLVAADLISALWLGAAGFFPLTILGVTWTADAILPIIVLDGALLILLVHYGWSMKLPLESPSERNLLYIAGIVFAAVAIVHLMRLAFNVDVALGTFEVPMWLSWIGVIITGYLSYTSFHFALKTKR